MKIKDYYDLIKSDSTLGIIVESISPVFYLFSIRFKDVIDAFEKSNKIEIGNSFFSKHVYLQNTIIEAVFELMSLEYNLTKKIVTDKGHSHDLHQMPSLEECVLFPDFFQPLNVFLEKINKSELKENNESIDEIIQRKIDEKFQPMELIECSFGSKKEVNDSAYYRLECLKLAVQKTGGSNYKSSTIVDMAKEFSKYVINEEEEKDLQAKK